MTDNINYIYEMIIKTYPTTTTAKGKITIMIIKNKSTNPTSKSKSKSKMIIELFCIKLQLTLDYLEICGYSIFVINGQLSSIL